MTQEDFEKINIARGYVHRPDGSWIISTAATPAEMIYHIEWMKQKDYLLP